MLLKDKNAVVYGEGGKVGGAVAHAFAREGARVFLAGRTQAKLEEVAEEIRSAGGVAETAQLDALDKQAVDRYVDAVAAGAGSLDISFNLISYDDVQGTPLTEMEFEDFEHSVMTAVSIETSMLKQVETLDDVGNVAAFAASELARTMTATAINITCGRVAD